MKNGLIFRYKDLFKNIKNLKGLRLWHSLREPPVTGWPPSCNYGYLKSDFQGFTLINVILI